MQSMIGVAILAAAASISARAGEADVVGAEAAVQADGTYRFDVTVRHSDQGWDHYANRWELVAPDGTTLGTRTLLHPHIAEQPFTRSLSDVEIPPEFTEVTIRAGDSVHDFGGAELTVPLPDRQ